MFDMKLTEEERMLRAEMLCERLGKVWEFAAICGVPPEHRDDVVQETMIAAYQNLGQLRDVEHFDGWLFRITKRKAGRFFHEQKKSLAREVCLEEWMAQQEEEDISAYQAWWAAEQSVDSEQLYAMVMSLRPPAPTIIRMRFEMGFSLKEVAEMMEMNYNTVKTVETRAFKKLRAMIVREEVGK